MKKEAVTLLGLGDIIIDREKPETIFQHAVGVLHAADIVYADCDQAYSDKGYLVHGHGTNSESRNIPALVNAGLDVVSLATNHSLDWGEEALLDTMARLRDAGLSCIGVGKNIGEARQPAILERKGNRVGFLAYCSVHPKGFEAEDDKPGLAPVRVWTIYEQVDYQPGTPPRIVTIPYQEDVVAMTEDIKRLKNQVDVVVVCVHWGLHMIPRVIPRYCFDVGHAAIDAGADLILGTHTHILKGIEVYKGKVIFYSNHNFAAEVGLKQKSMKGNVSFLKQLGGWYKDIARDPEESRATIVSKAVIEDGKIKRVSFLPCYINEQSEPEILPRSDARSQKVYDYVEDISRSEGLNVHFSWDGEEVLIMP